jgi:hypothetical protein
VTILPIDFRPLAKFVNSETITVNERRVSIALGDGDDVLPRRPTSAICAVV